MPQMLIDWILIALLDSAYLIVLTPNMYIYIKLLCTEKKIGKRKKKKKNSKLFCMYIYRISLIYTMTFLLNYRLLCTSFCSKGGWMNAHRWKLHSGIFCFHLHLCHRKKAHWEHACYKNYFKDWFLATDNSIWNIKSKLLHLLYRSQASHSQCITIIIS